MELAGPGGMRVRVQVFPHSAALGRDVERAWNAVAPDVPDSETLRSELELRLQRWYPLLSVQAQSRLGSMVDVPLWYVFRDGRVRAQQRTRDGLYEAMARARDTRTSIQQTLDRSVDTLREANRSRPARSLRGGNPGPERATDPAPEGVEPVEVGRTS